MSSRGGEEASTGNGIMHLGGDVRQHGMEPGYPKPTDIFEDVGWSQSFNSSHKWVSCKQCDIGAGSILA